MPLADHEGGVAGAVEHLGHRGRLVGDAAPHVGEPGAEVRDGPHAHRVVVAAGEQRGPGGRAQRRDVEVREAQATGGEAVDVGRREVGPVAAEVGEAEVVEEDHHDVRGMVAGVGGIGPRRLGLGDGPADDPVEPVGVVRTVHRPILPSVPAPR